MADASVPAPNGCGWCGVDKPDHLQRWTTGVGWHTWSPPTQTEIKNRMRARRAAKKDTSHG